MIEDHAEFMKELATCCAGIDEHIDRYAMSVTLEYWLR